MHLTYVNKRERSRRWYIPRYKSTVSNRTFHVAAQYLNVVEPLAVARILRPNYVFPFVIVRTRAKPPILAFTRILTVMPLLFLNPSLSNFVITSLPHCLKKLIVPLWPYRRGGEGASYSVVYIYSCLLYTSPSPRD